MITIAAQGIFVLNVAITLLRTAKMRDTNPWRAASLEWVAFAPNSISDTITVHHGAYEFLPAGIRDGNDDFVPQNAAPTGPLPPAPPPPIPGPAPLNPLGST